MARVGGRARTRRAGDLRGGTRHHRAQGSQGHHRALLARPQGGRQAARPSKRRSFTRLVSKLEVMEPAERGAGLAAVVRHAAAIEVISAQPHWVELLVPCTREAAEQIHPGRRAARSGDLPTDVIESVSYAFRELLLNAVEWGGQLDPDRQVRIACVRTNRC